MITTSHKKRFRLRCDAYRERFKDEDFEVKMDFQRLLFIYLHFDSQIPDSVIT